jgi:Protein of unknown function (DUF1177)
MALKQVIEIYELLDSPRANGERVASLLKERGIHGVEVVPIQGEKGKTDSIKVWIPGSKGKKSGGNAPTLGVIGRLGGVGARPQMIGLVSDADGAIAALSIALKLADMKEQGDVLPGDVIVATHVCPDAPTLPHDPVPFMGSPVEMKSLNDHEVDPQMDAILSIDTTKGNRIINLRGFAISPTVKEGYILKVSEDLLFHLNSIMQPSVATPAPVVGLAITAESVVPGCATGASHVTDIEEAVRFSIEVAKTFAAGQCRFHDEQEFKRIIELYGPMNHLQTLGGKR